MIRSTRALATVALMGGVGLLVTGFVGQRNIASSPRPLPDMPATAMDRVEAKANNSPMLVADPLHPSFVAMAHRVDAPEFDCALQISGDGGKGWTAASPVPTLPPSVDRCYAPEVGFDRHGTLYYLFVGLAGPGNRPSGVYLSASTDYAMTFSAPREVLGAANFSVRMAIDRGIGKKGRIHLVWLHASSDPTTGGFSPAPNPIMTAYSDDGGQTFSGPSQVDDGQRARIVAPALTIGPDHALHIAYYDLRDDAVDYQGLEGDTWSGTWSIVMATSRDSGTHFGPPIVIDDAVVPPDRVMLVFTMPPPALATGGRTVCAGWTDGRDGDADAFASCSRDKGHRFPSPVRLNDDPVGNGKSQYEPQLAISPSGRVDAVFYDRRNSIQNIRNDVSFTYSTNGGNTFARNVTLNHWGSSLTRIGPEYAVPSAKGQVEFGSRIGLLATATGAVAAWTDTRNSADFTTDQDVFTAQIVGLPSVRRKLGWLLTGGTALFLAGAAGVLGRQSDRLRHLGRKSQSASDWRASDSEIAE